MGGDCYLIVLRPSLTFRWRPNGFFFSSLVLKFRADRTDGSWNTRPFEIIIISSVGAARCSRGEKKKIKPHGGFRRRSCVSGRDGGRTFSPYRCTDWAKYWLISSSPGGLCHPYPTSPPLHRVPNGGGQLG